MLVISVWLEPAADEPFRARITVERDLDVRRRGTTAVWKVSDLFERVETWVHELVQTGDG